MLFPREFTLIFSIYYYLNVSTVCPGLKAISSNIQLNKTKMLLLKCYLKCNSLCNRLRMSDSDDDWTGFLGEQTDSEDDQPIRAKHIMQDRKTYLEFTSFNLWRFRVEVMNCFHSQAKIMWMCMKVLAKEIFSSRPNCRTLHFIWEMVRGIR